MRRGDTKLDRAKAQSKKALTKVRNLCLKLRLEIGAGVRVFGLQLIELSAGLCLVATPALCR